MLDLMRTFDRANMIQH